MGLKVAVLSSRSITLSVTVPNVLLYTGHAETVLNNVLALLFSSADASDKRKDLHPQWDSNPQPPD